MKPFVIYTYDYNPGVGGIKVMHKLCDMLNANGAKAYLMPIHAGDEFSVCSDYNTPLITQEIYDNIEDTIVIYPEGIRFNPLNSKNVVRWILGPINQQQYESYSNTDLIYYFLSYFHNRVYNKDLENQLLILEFHENIFTKLNQERKGSCYTIRKGILTNKHPEDSIFIPFSSGAVGNLVELAELFNRTERFYCYDTYTFLSIQAAMCGCISIVIPDPTVTKDEWLNGARLHKYGIAYGEDDIDRALETLPLLFKEIEQTKLEMNKNVIKFIEHCNNYYK